MNDKSKVFSQIEEHLQQLGFTIIDKDYDRPWGGFIVIDESLAQDFAAHFFNDVDFQSLTITNKLSPKILMVAPGKKLSWQYHNRRAEIWSCMEGPVGVMTSDTDVETTRHILEPGDIIRLHQGERHRLMGLEDWGIVAEIWQHTDENNPSDEDDIVRLQDDFGRK
jgi:mannose-6-phosphate isomerase-like protein (cupin superfamily)